jgi:tol-pal system protein YbgF
MIHASAQLFRAAAFAVPALIFAATASAQERSPGLLDNIFGGNPPAQAQPPQQMGPADLVVRLDRLEAQVRQLTGTVEQLQFRNQQLEQMLAGRTAPQPAPPSAPAAAPQAATPPIGSQQFRPPAPGVPGAVGAPPPPQPGRRSDVFDPNQNPNAPGAPQTLGSVPVIADPGNQAPGGRQAGAPLDLSTLSGAAANDPSLASAGTGDGMLPPPPPRNPNATGAQVTATAPPSQTPKDTFDLSVGYMKRKEFAAADESFRDFLRKYPSDRMVPDAQYWLGESLYQRQRYRDAAESFLAVTTKYESSAKAPDALLRLGQSLAALGEKETACAAWGEIGRKYARASAGVKTSVAAEQKRVRC